MFIYGVFKHPVSLVESVFYTTAIFKQHTLKILQEYLPLYKDKDLRVMMSQVRDRGGVLQKCYRNNRLAHGNDVKCILARSHAMVM